MRIHGQGKIWTGELDPVEGAKRYCIDIVEVWKQNVCTVEILIQKNAVLAMKCSK